MTGPGHTDDGHAGDVHAAEAEAAAPHVVYCGGCNPHIDRGAVAAALGDEETGAVTGGTVFLSGCPRACASHHRLTAERPDHVVVAGETVDGRPTRAEGIPAAVRRRLEE